MNEALEMMRLECVSILRKVPAESVAVGEYIWCIWVYEIVLLLGYKRESAKCKE